MINPEKRRLQTRRAIWPVALLILLSGHRAGALAQDAQQDRATTPAEQLVAKLKAACMSDLKLHGALVQRGDLKEGKLSLHGTIDSQEQAGLLEAAAARLVEASPRWKEAFPDGLSASSMVVFPIKSELLPKLRADFAHTTNDSPREATLFQQTRIDDLYFDAHGGLQVVGLCINHEAFVAARDASTAPNQKPVSKIGTEVSKRLTGYPFPENVDRRTISRVSAGGITLAENPVRVLQRLAQDAKLVDVVFREAWFDAKGELKVDGLLGGGDEDRTAAASLVSQPEFLKAYSRPEGAPPLDPAAVVAPMSVVPWQKAPVAALQKRFADEKSVKGSSRVLRHCRIERATFLYPDGGSLMLRFEGIMLLDGNESTAAVNFALKTDTDRSSVFPPALSSAYHPRNDLTRLPTPLHELRKKVASTPSLDGLRLDDVVFGPTGELTLVGRWLGPDQTATIDALLTPVVVEHTRNRLRGPLARRLTELPTDRLLQSLRKRLISSPAEAGLDRLFFRPVKERGAHPEVVLQGATIVGSLPQVKSQLEGWLEADALAREIGAPVVELTPRPKSLLMELRKLVAGRSMLDGVLIKSVYFDEQNNLVLSGREDHQGQWTGASELVGKAAAVAWKGLPRPKVAPAGAFQVFPLAPLLKKLSSTLPNYEIADGVILDRAYYNDRAELVIHGRDSRGPRNPRALKQLIEKLVADDTDIKIATPELTRHARDTERSAKICGEAVRELCASNLARFPLRELDEAVFLDPFSSSAWYLRGAYYYVSGDTESAKRDLQRAGKLDKKSSSDLGQLLVRFQGDLRRTLDSLMEAP